MAKVVAEAVAEAEDVGATLKRNGKKNPPSPQRKRWCNSLSQIRSRSVCKRLNWLTCHLRPHWYLLTPARMIYAMHLSAPSRRSSRQRLSTPLGWYSQLRSKNSRIRRDVGDHQSLRKLTWAMPSLIWRKRSWTILCTLIMASQGTCPPPCSATSISWAHGRRMALTHSTSQKWAWSRFSVSPD